MEDTTPPVMTGSKRHQTQSPETTSGRQPSKRATRDVTSPPPYWSLCPGEDTLSHASPAPSISTSTMPPLRPVPQPTRRSSRRSTILGSHGQPVASSSSLLLHSSSGASADQRRNVNRLQIFNASTDSLAQHIHTHQNAEATWRRQQAAHRRAIEGELQTMLETTNELAASDNLQSSFTQAQILQFQHSVAQFFRGLSEELRSDPRVFQIQEDIITILSTIEQ